MEFFFKALRSAETNFKNKMAFLFRAREGKIVDFSLRSEVKGVKGLKFSSEGNTSKASKAWISGVGDEGGVWESDKSKDLSSLHSVMVKFMRAETPEELESVL